jgi:hypothetical protein
MLSNLEQSILATLAYFDIFEYPLTLFEIWKNLVNVGNGNSIPQSCGVGFPSLCDIEDALNNEELKNKISRKNGFYFLKSVGAQNFVPNYLTRQKRYYIADKKFKRAKKIVWLLSKIPYIKMIAVCNSLGYSNAMEDSDIDFFVITAKNRIWTARFLSVVLIKFLNLRPKIYNIKDLSRTFLGRIKLRYLKDISSINELKENQYKKVRDKICLSFFVDEENLNLEKFAINPPYQRGDETSPPDKGGWGVKAFDIYLIYWITQLVPIFNHGGIYDKFWQENKWLKKYLPNRISYKVNNRRKIGKKELSFDLESFRDSSFKPNWLEKLTKKIQLKMMNPKLKSLMNKDTRVIVNDGVLKLFAIDRREEYLKLWHQKISF